MASEEELVKRLYDHLEGACKVPLQTGSPGSALSLAIHCILADYGFVLVGPGTVPDAIRTTVDGKTTSSTLRPPSEWQAASPVEWNTEYVLPGKCCFFKMTVALHEESGRMFVHAAEDNNLNNIQILGLMLPIYVPDKRLFNDPKSTWREVLCNAGMLIQHVTMNIAEPLKLKSKDGPTPAIARPKTSTGILDSCGTWLTDHSSTVTTAITLVSLGLAVGLSVAWWRNRNRT